MSEIIYAIQQSNRSNWETIPEGEFETEAAALDAMAELEENLGWRNLRVVAAGGNSLEVVLYGVESEEEEED